MKKQHKNCWLLKHFRKVVQHLEITKTGSLTLLLSPEKVKKLLSVGDLDGWLWLDDEIRLDGWKLNHKGIRMRIMISPVRLFLLKGDKTKRSTTAAVFSALLLVTPYYWIKHRLFSCQKSSDISLKTVTASFKRAIYFLSRCKRHWNHNNHQHHLHTPQLQWKSSCFSSSSSWSPHRCCSSSFSGLSEGVRFEVRNGQMTVSDAIKSCSSILVFKARLSFTDLSSDWF